MMFTLIGPDPARSLARTGQGGRQSPGNPRFPGRHQRVVTAPGGEGSDHNLSVHYSR